MAPIEDNRLVIATHNRGKMSEIAESLDGLGLKITSSAELNPFLHAPEEIHETFLENALLKARVCYQATGCLTLADDSGLEVDALHGRPGVRSARYAGENASSEAMIAKVLSELQGVPEEERQARFVCVVALVGTGVERTFRGTCEGTIARVPQGAGGFGYDPIFLDPESGMTFSEMTAHEKSERSHRGRALLQVRDYLRQIQLA